MAKNVGPVTTAATAAAAVVMVACWVLTTATGIEVPSEVQGSATVALVALAGYLVPGAGGSHRDG